MMLLFTGVVCLLLQTASNLGAATLPAGFIETTIDGTYEDFVGVAFDAIGSVYAWDRLGRVWIIENDVKLPTPVLDISEEVGGYHDHGMLGLAHSIEAGGLVVGLAVAGGLAAGWGPRAILQVAVGVLAAATALAIVTAVRGRSGS